jgi:signal transduction histidine kinase
MSNLEIVQQFMDPSHLLKLALDLLDLEIMFVDRNFKILFMNRAKRDVYPQIPVEAGVTCYETMEHYGERCPHCVVYRAMESGEVQYDNHYTSVGLEGEVRHIRISALPVFDENGGVIGAIEAVYNITDLVEANQQLETLNKEYESVIYALSHDLRSPLVSIEGFVRKLEKNHLDMEDEKARHCVDRIRSNVHMMNDFVMVLLDTSRISTGKLQMEPVETGELVNEVISQFQEQVAARKGRLTCEGTFPTVKSDRIRLFQVFNNLVGNALAHSGTQEGLEIEIGCDGKIFWVRDNGPGMPEGFSKKAFEPFSQATNTHGDHFGMGMNIVYKIIQKHSGRTWIDSTPDVGTCIYFTLDPRHKMVRRATVRQRASNPEEVKA